MFHYHSLFEAASRAGCDLMVDAATGNHTFSCGGPWAYPEFLMTGKWKQLWLALRRDPTRYKSFTRTFLSRAIAPLLPDSIWFAIRRARGHADLPANDHVGALRPDIIAQHGLRDRAQQAGVLFRRSHMRNRQAFMRDIFARGDGHGGDVIQGFEQVYGVAWRDVTAYRPFVEFCVGLPVDVFMHDGQNRWLARELGKGLIPEEQRLNRKYGFHSCDWHERITPRLPELRAELVRAARDPDLADTIDFERLLHTIDNWPEQSSLEDETFYNCAMAIPRAIMTARYVRFVSGRNEG